MVAVLSIPLYFKLHLCQKTYISRNLCTNFVSTLSMNLNVIADFMNCKVRKQKRRGALNLCILKHRKTKAPIIV